MGIDVDIILAWRRRRGQHKRGYRLSRCVHLICMMKIKREERK
jgi:hypothetical protein